MTTQLKKVFSLFGLVLIFTGCRNDGNVIEERVMLQNPPTLYEFDATLEEVQRAINNARGSKWQDKQKLHEKTDLVWINDENPFAKKIFEDVKNKNDAFLCGVGLGESVGKSKVYSKNGEELAYYADFQIHLTTIKPSRVRVEINTFDNFPLLGVRSFGIR